MSELCGRRDVAAAGLLIGLVWAVGALLPLGIDPVDGREDGIYLVTDLWYSVMLASFAVVGWFGIRIAPRSRLVAGTASLLAVAALAAALGNLLEDVFGLPGAENMYFFGFFAVLIGLAALAVPLLARRLYLAGAIVAATFVGVVVMAGHGPPLVPVIWLLVAATGVTGALLPARSRSAASPDR